MRPSAPFRFAARTSTSKALTFAFTFAFGAFAPAARADAPQPTTYSLRWVRRMRGERCIGQRELGEAVERLLRGGSFVATSRGSIEVEGQIGPRPGGGWVTVLVRLDAGGGPSKTLELSTDGADCRELDESIAFNAALLIDHTLHAQRPALEWFDANASSEPDPWQNLPLSEPDPWQGLPPSEPDPWYELPRPPEAAPASASRRRARRGAATSHEGAFELSALLAYGMGTRVLPSNEILSRGGFGVGVGLRAGYGFDSGLWLGVSYTHYFGSPIVGVGAPPGGAGGEVTGSFRADVLSAEVGYTFAAGSVELRPHFGLGPVSYRLEASSPRDGALALRVPATLGVWPGASLNLPFDPFFFGAELRWAIIADAEPVFPLSLALASGLRF